jgi:hypothetical protein
MSDLDTSLDELREDLRSTISKPALDRIADRARQRSVRRRMQIGAIVAVVLVSVAVPLLRSLPEPTPPAAPPTPAEPSSVPYQVGFADRTHAFALGRECPEPFKPCTFKLLASTDAGQSWQRRSMPKGTYTDGSLGVLGPKMLLFYTTTVDDQDFMVSYISQDDGRTWRRHEIASPLLTSPSPIPAHTPIQPICLSGSGAGCVMGIGTVAADGKVAPVPVQPQLTELWPGRFSTAGGRYWVVGKDQTNHWAVAVTADGTAWTTTALDVPGTVDVPDAWSVVEGGGSMYLTAIGSIGGGTNKLLTMYRSTDRGRTWTQTRRASETGEQMPMYGEPIAMSNGRLLLNSLPDGTVESRDGGRTFTKAARQLAGNPRWTPGGYLVQVRLSTYELSWNGVDWRRFEMP